MKWTRRPLHLSPLRLASGGGWRADACAHASSHGFACQPSPCPLLDGVVKGAKIEATFGAKLVGGRDTFIYELLHVRLGEAERRAFDFEPAPCVGAAWALFHLLLPGRDMAPWPQEGVFAGYYGNGFEVSDFRPAG